MQAVRAVVRTAIADSPRVQLVGGMFDLGVPAAVETTFQAELPDLTDDWRIGAIVGPSGSGKSTLARAAYADKLRPERPWPKRKAVVDCFGNADVRRVTALLTAVGFSSPPAWIRPFQTLSHGEQFRANLARALLASRELLVYDEFTSVVDRNVAKIGSAAVAKSVRKGLIPCRFVAVTCHYDVLPWLQPDWVLDTADYTLRRRRLRRPSLRLEICRCLPDAWRLFRRHHYLSAKLCTRGVRCFLGLVDDQPVAFAAVLPCPGLTGNSRVSRLVVLPDWQGVGVGRAFARLLGAAYTHAGRRLHLRTGHAMMIRCLAADPQWQLGKVNKYGSSEPVGDLSREKSRGKHFHRVSRRPGASFVYVGPLNSNEGRP